MKLALFDELGELLHEFPTQYKHWKKNAVDNREKGLEEYVDVLHFALSLANHFEIRVNKNYIYEKCKYDTELSYILHDLYSSVCRQWENSMMYDLFVLGNYFGFSWEEIYTAYKEKNAINYQRIRDGY